MTPDIPTRLENDARHRLDVDDITIPENRLRAVQEDAITTLAESMALIGLRLPITVRQTSGPGGDGAGEGFVVVAGAHRLLAAKRLGWERIDATCLEGDETEARLWEIAENLHRAELKALERAEHLAEWLRLTAARQAGESGKPAQLAQLSATGGRGREGGASAATRALGVSRREGQRALKIAALDPAAKAVARELDLDDNQSALLAAAGKGDADAQVAALRETARRKRAKAGSTEAGEAGPARRADQAVVVTGGEGEARAEPGDEVEPERADATREDEGGDVGPARRADQAVVADGWSGEDGEAHAEPTGEGDPERAEARGDEAGDAGPARQADQAAVVNGEDEEDLERAIAQLAHELVSSLPEPRRRALRALLADERAGELLVGHLRGELAEPTEGTAAPADSPEDFEKTGAA
jgi:ParB-like chromosome segregation protein Spo0J